MTVLPTSCRPSSHSVFNVIINDAASIRVDVGSDGSVFWAGGAKAANWVPFDTIHFSVATAEKRMLALGNGWTSMAEYGKVAYTLEGSYCILTGVAKSKTPKWDPLIAVLPNECLPADGRVVFSVNANGYTHRVDVTADGEIVWVAGKIDYGMDWISLSGISFFAGKTAKVLEMVSPFSPYAQGYRIPQYHKQGRLCSLSGVVKNPSGTSNVVITNLPEECRPVSGRLIFSTNKDTFNERIDVRPDGSVRYIEGTRTAGWLSLDGVSFIVDQSFAATQALAAVESNKADASAAQEAEGRKAIIELLGLRPGTINAGKEYLPAQFVRVGQMCLVSGVLKVSQLKDKLLVLPANCRPDIRGAFLTSRGAQHVCRTDVLPSGDVQFMGGDSSGGFFPLDQFTFPVARSKLNPIVFNKPWYFAHDGQVVANSAGSGWAREGKWCVLSGILRNPLAASTWSSGQTFAILDEGCRPSASIMLNFNHGFVHHRVDIQPNGHMVWVKGTPTSNYLSLFGANFVVGETAQSISLLNGWKPYGQGYRAPSYTRQGEVCFLSGVMTTSLDKGTQLIAVLAPDCRPAGTLMFAVLQGDSGEAHVEIDFTGSIKWWGGLVKTGLLSLEGIRFAVRSPKPLSLAVVEGQPGGHLSANDLSLAPDAEAFSSGIVASPTNQVAHLKDGLFGDAKIWSAKAVGAGKKIFAGIKFAWLVEVQSIAFGRSNQDGGNKDSVPSSYTIQYSPNFLDDRDFDSEWLTIGDISTRTLQLPSRRHAFNFNRPVLAGSLRILCSSFPCALDEIEAYGKPLLGMTFGGAAGGTFDHSNWARTRGTVVFASSNSPVQSQQMNNINDGKYGGDSSWQPAADQQGLKFVGVSFPEPLHISAIALGRDNTGKLTDRVDGQYIVQYSTRIANEKTPDNEWTTVGSSLLLSSLPQPALRHVWNIEKTIKASAVRVIVSNANMAIDELELYPHAVNA